MEGFEKQWDNPRPGKVIRSAEPTIQRTYMGEDVKSILEGTLHILQLYTDILNGMSPRTYVVGSEVKLD